ncbi:heme oxygenase (biliverdin-producing) [Nocardioides lianchengensis]|uniref:heme oxygenase (biliverdin-producing) n=1 Tax=Nocardioides lianchengensis TaxID=1045774 RepID=A0A1G6J1H2_9ACTN|nr:biliverdin-producing heme oxygenase [Nocardioides lianchengensis]NYG12886.1 heme oxygenase [Nocardioides lianchengensis]SDC12500.1 heme oxygenase [Nocardioides lianchengensis]
MTVLDHTSVDDSLSTAMREGSMAEHEAAEHSSFMTELMGGKLVEQAYADYLLRYRGVYDALETAIRSRLDDPAVAAVHDTALERLAAIDADLDHWSPGGPRTTDSAATTAYRERLESVAAWGPALVAHHYTRYLGDLSGGQAIGRILDRTYELGGVGIAFYDFAEIPKPKPYKDAYRARLDGLVLSAEDKLRVVDEVKVAFRLNQAVFTELGQSIDGYRR